MTDTPITTPAEALEAAEPSDESEGELLARLGMDGRLWAEEFHKTAQRLGYQPMDEGWLIGWFANAIMAGYDHAPRIAAQVQAEAVAEGVEPQTPAAKWREEGKPDPHGTRYDCERAKLAKGHLTDDELANGVYMVDRNSLDLIVWQEAAKDRIRWLSRALEAAQAKVAKVTSDRQFIIGANHGFETAWEQIREQLVDNAIKTAPDHLRELGAWLANQLDEDDWPTAERYLNAAVLSIQPAAPAPIAPWTIPLQPPGPVAVCAICDIAGCHHIREALEAENG